MNAAIDPSHLLKRLEPPVRPIFAAAPAQAGQRPIEQRNFDELLALVSRGGVRSGRPVMVPAGVELREPLTSEQLERLAVAADLAESSGAQQALMLIDGRALIMDVESRTVASEINGGDGHRLLDIDAAVYVAGEDEEAGFNRPLPFPPAGVLPANIARQIAERMHQNGEGTEIRAGG